MADLVRIGIVGAGGFTRRRLLPGLLAVPGVELAAVANRTLASAERVAQEFRIAKALADWRDVVTSSDVDAVVVATDWWGMMEDDKATVANILAVNPSNTLTFIDRVHQGMVNFVALAARRSRFGVSYRSLPKQSRPVQPRSSASTKIMFGGLDAASAFKTANRAIMQRTKNLKNSMANCASMFLTTQHWLCKTPPCRHAGTS